MADDKKNIPDVAPPTEAPAPTVEVTAVPEPPAPEPVLTDAEAVMLEQEGHAALFEMGDAVPDPADAVTRAEVEEPAAPKVPKAEKEQAQSTAPGKDDPAPVHSGKVVDFAAARDGAAKDEKKALKQRPPAEKDKAAKPGRGRPPKDGKAAPDKAKQSKPRDKKSQSKPIPEKPAVDKGGAPAGAEVTPEPSAPRDATRAEKEEIVYLNHGNPALPGVRQGFPPGWAAAVLLPGLCRGCPAGAKAGVYAPQAEVVRGKIAPENACIYKAFPGRFWGGRYVFPSAPVFAEMLSTSKQQDFGTFCPEVPAERRNYA